MGSSTNPNTCPKCGAPLTSIHFYDHNHMESHVWWRCPTCDPATPPAPADDAGAVTRAERDNSIYDDAAEYIAERDVLRNALACAAVPLEVLAATECDDNGKALAPTTKAAVLRAVEAIRAALRGKHPQGGHDTGNARGEE